ncbi:MAG: response regulator [Desulfobacterales bacterium]|nr:response regulator [Desulfobacterales bacterium]
MPNILIVDDQPCVQQLLSEELIREGYGVDSVGDAESVRQYLIFSQPDIVLLDLYLDGPEGFGLLEDIKRQYPPTARIPRVRLDRDPKEPDPVGKK